MKDEKKVNPEEPMADNTIQPVAEPMPETTTPEEPTTSPDGMGEETQTDTPQTEPETIQEKSAEQTDEVGMELEDQDKSLVPQEIKDRLTAIVKRFYPEAKTDTDMELLAAALPMVEGLVAWHDVWDQIVKDDPKAADFILDITENGYSFPEAIALNFSEDELMPPEGVPDRDKVIKAHEERMGRIAAKDEALAKITYNRELTATNLLEVQKELGLDDETTSNIGKLLGQILVDATSDGIVSKDNWIKLANGLRYEAAMKEKDAENEKSYEDGRIAGRNEKIEKKRAGKETGTGLPNLTNSGNVDEKLKKKAIIPLKKEFRV